MHRLHQVDVLVARGESIADATREVGLTESDIIAGARSTAR